GRRGSRRRRSRAHTAGRTDPASAGSMGETCAILVYFTSPQPLPEAGRGFEPLPPSGGGWGGGISRAGFPFAGLAGRVGGGAAPGRRWMKGSGGVLRY